MKGKIIIVPITTVQGETFYLAYKTLKKACKAQGVSYNSATSYFKDNPNKDRYFHKKTNITFVKTELV